MICTFGDWKGVIQDAIKLGQITIIAAFLSWRQIVPTMPGDRHYSTDVLIACVFYSKVPLQLLLC